MYFLLHHLYFLPDKFVTCNQYKQRNLNPEFEKIENKWWISIIS